MAIDFGNLILNETPDAVIVTTPDGTVVCWTNGAQALFGYAAEEALGQPLASLIVPPELADEERTLRQRTLDDGAANYESMRRAKDGTLVYIDSSSKAVRDADGAVAHILWSKKDVTPFKVLRDARLVEARFGGLLDTLPDAIVVANAGGRVVLANVQAEALFGYGPGALRGVPLELLMPARFRTAHVGHRIGYAMGRQPQARAMGSDQDLYGLRRDGSEFPVEISLSPFATEDGTLVMSAIRDIGERKRIERALHEKNVELAQANAAKDRFLAGMSHELRTPLNAIIGFTGTMLMKLPGPINEEQGKQLRTVQSSARHLLSLINDLLDLTKIESGKVDLDLRPLACRPLIEEVLPLFRQQARNKGLNLEFASPAQEHTVLTDRRALQQILINLVNNAIKFTDQGQVSVRLGVTRTEQRECVAISVSDTGRGIAPAQQARLFQAFTQLEPGAAFEGTGLGLHLSQKLAHLLGGQITCESQPGTGSIFTLALPRE
jgi:PAS domain S-box-containing protein